MTFLFPALISLLLFSPSNSSALQLENEIPSHQKAHNKSLEETYKIELGGNEEKYENELDPKMVFRAMKSIQHGILKCIKDGNLRNEFESKFLIAFQIDKHGRVKTSNMRHSLNSNPQIDQCLLHKTRVVKFKRSNYDLTNFEFPFHVEKRK